MSGGWIGIDLDGTLAEYHGWKGIHHIGAPIPAMVKRVKRYLRDGHDVRCFTARVHNDSHAAMYVRQWLDEQGLHHMGQTCVKDRDMILLIDDRAVRAQKNTGKLLNRVVMGKPCRR